MYIFKVYLLLSYKAHKIELFVILPFLSSTVKRVYTES